MGFLMCSFAATRCEQWLLKYTVTDIAPSPQEQLARAFVGLLHEMLSGCSIPLCSATDVAGAVADDAAPAVAERP
ncbi:hypothetical protein OHA77_14060 [Streptosporangium sp. NBC_01639]|uniref:hypothetical protein n=1 Tax=Streptosporangium sp. NBC_01639 TaxID=2975948 RepID=UPI00386E31ED|nr:hypothetical protein OHA77_14060 [Streptosporangium sp. NBC_01639]